MFNSFGSSRIGFVVACFMSICSLLAMAAEVSAQKVSVVNLKCNLTGSLDGVAVSGKASFVDKGSNLRTLKVQLENIARPDGSRLSIQTNGVLAGFMTVTAGKAKFEAQTNPKDPILGDPVPVLHAGDVITIHPVTVGAASGPAFASGTF